MPAAQMRTGIAIFLQWSLFAVNQMINTKQLSIL